MRTFLIIVAGLVVGRATAHPATTLQRSMLRVR